MPVSDLLTSVHDSTRSRAGTAVDLAGDMCPSPEMYARDSCSIGVLSSPAVFPSLSSKLTPHSSVPLCDVLPPVDTVLVLSIFLYVRHDSNAVFCC